MPEYIFKHLNMVLNHIRKNNHPQLFIFDMKINYKYIFYIFLFTILILNSFYVTQQWVWHTYDEWAHYDYIEQLSNGQWPAPTDLLSENTKSMSQEFGATFTAEDNQYSYEAQQPPVYYLLLVVPKKIMDLWDFSPHVQIQVLRIFNPIFIFIASLLLIAIFNELNRQYQINVVYGYLLAVWLMFPGAIYWSGINNNYLSVIWNHWAILSLLRYQHRGHLNEILYASLAVTLSFLTKYTNGYMVLLVGGFWIVMFWKNRQYYKIQHFFLPLTPLLLIFSYLWYNWQHENWLNIHTDFFSESVEPITSALDFIYLLGKSSLNIEHLMVLPNFVVWGFLILFILNLFFSVFKIFLGERVFIPLFIAACLTLTLMITAMGLNFYVPGVYWFNFRHYAGYSLFWFIALFALPWLTPSLKAVFIKLMSVILLSLAGLLAYDVWKGFLPESRLLVNAKGDCLAMQPDYKNGSRLKAVTCNNSEAQLWVYHPRFKLLQGTGNHCIDSSIDENWRRQQGSILFVWKCANSWNHKWLREGSQFAIEEGQCLTTNTEEIPWIHLAPCTNAPSQQWRFKNPAP